eukprot:IDg11575t1
MGSSSTREDTRALLCLASSSKGAEVIDGGWVALGVPSLDPRPANTGAERGRNIDEAAVRAVPGSEVSASVSIAPEVRRASRKQSRERHGCFDCEGNGISGGAQSAIRAMAERRVQNV